MDYSIKSEGPVGKKEVRAIFITTEVTDDPAEPYYEDHKDAIVTAVNELVKVVGGDEDLVDIKITGTVTDGHTGKEAVIITISSSSPKTEKEEPELEVKLPKSKTPSK